MIQAQSRHGQAEVIAGISSLPPVAPSGSVPLLAVQRVPGVWLPRCEGTMLRPANANASAPHRPQPPLIYAVDDLDHLTELYTVVLENSGYLVRAFTDRVAALATLKDERRKPGLLITDYGGGTLPINRFLQQCRALHPALRILMASGFSETDIQFADTKPDRFLRKPFTARMLCDEVRALWPASATGWPESDT